MGAASCAAWCSGVERRPLRQLSAAASAAEATWPPCSAREVSSSEESRPRLASGRGRGRGRGRGKGRGRGRGMG